jgi:hypothetical protein
MQEGIQLSQALTGDGAAIFRHAWGVRPRRHCLEARRVGGAVRLLAEETDQDALRVEAKYRKWGLFGFWLAIFGIILQVIGTWVSPMIIDRSAILRRAHWLLFFRVRWRTAGIPSEPYETHHETLFRTGARHLPRPPVHQLRCLRAGHLWRHHQLARRLRLDRRLPSLYPLSHSAAARGKSRRRRRYYWSPPLEIRVLRRLRDRPDTRIAENGFDAVRHPEPEQDQKTNRPNAIPIVDSTLPHMAPHSAPGVRLKAAAFSCRRQGQ